MSYMENGSRFATVAIALANHADIVAINVPTTSHVDERKGRVHNETVIKVAPREGVLKAAELSQFANSLLNDYEPIFRNGEEISTFDSHERTSHKVSIQVYPSIAAAEK